MDRYRLSVIPFPILLLLVSPQTSSSGVADLGEYSLRFEQCHALPTYDDELAQQDADGDTTAGVLGIQRFVSFRLCPTDTNGSSGSCDSDSDGYGEYLLDLETYLETTVYHYLDSQEQMCKGCQDYCSNLMEEEPVVVVVVEERQQQPEQDYDCDTCQDECIKIQHMEENGYIDATEFLECQMIYDPEDDQLSALYAGPVCTGSGSAIQIGVYRDEDCRILDSTKRVDDYLMDGDGHRMKLSHALLKQTYRAEIDCRTSRGNEGENGGVCQHLWDTAAKCEKPHGMIHGMHNNNNTNTTAASHNFYRNQIQQEYTVCDFFGALKEKAANGGGEGTPPLLQAFSTGEQPSSHPIAAARARNRGGGGRGGEGGGHYKTRRRRSEDEGYYYYYDQPSMLWLDAYSLELNSCFEFPQWNRRAYTSENVRLFTKRLVRYRLCPNEHDPCSPNATATAEHDERCGDYTVDLSDFLENYLGGNQQQLSIYCDYLKETVCAECDSRDDSSSCWNQCYRLYGTTGHCNERNNRTSVTASEEEPPQRVTIPNGFMGCVPVPSSFLRQSGPNTNNLEDDDLPSPPALFIGPYCGAAAASISAGSSSSSSSTTTTRIRLGLFTDDTCTIFLSSDLREQLVPFWNISTISMMITDHPSVIHYNHQQQQDKDNNNNNNNNLCVSCSTTSSSTSFEGDKLSTSATTTSSSSSNNHDVGGGAGVCERLYYQSGKCETGMFIAKQHTNNACQYLENITTAANKAVSVNINNPDDDSNGNILITTTIGTTAVTRAPQQQHNDSGGGGGWYDDDEVLELSSSNAHSTAAMATSEHVMMIGGLVLFLLFLF